MVFPLLLKLKLAELTLLPEITPDTSSWERLKAPRSRVSKPSPPLTLAPLNPLYKCDRTVPVA
ncbi:MAG: hypothetical protein V7K92_01740 [Nostoc sp.]